MNDANSQPAAIWFLALNSLGILLGIPIKLIYIYIYMHIYRYIYGSEFILIFV